MAWEQSIAAAELREASWPVCNRTSYGSSGETGSPYVPREGGVGQSARQGPNKGIWKELAKQHVHLPFDPAILLGISSEHIFLQIQINIGTGF